MQRNGSVAVVVHQHGSMDVEIYESRLDAVIGLLGRGLGKDRTYGSPAHLDALLCVEQELELRLRSVRADLEQNGGGAP